MGKGQAAPEGCDCCGRDAEDCGMLESGWVTDRHQIAGGGTYCRRCAHLLGVERLVERCAWCETAMAGEEESDSIGWGYFADMLGVLHPCCPSCLAQRFGIDRRRDRRRSR